MPKLTMDDVAKKLEEIRAQTKRVKQPNTIATLLEIAKNRGNRQPRLPLRRPR